MRAFGKVWFPPVVKLKGDKEGMMAGHGELMALTEHTALWRFGFLEGTAPAMAYKCHHKEGGFLWVMTAPEGKVLETWKGFAYKLPEQYQRVMREAGGPYSWTSGGNGNGEDQGEPPVFIN